MRTKNNINAINSAGESPRKEAAQRSINDRNSPHLIKNILYIPTSHEVLVPLIVFVMIAGTLAFITIADEIREGDSQHIDELILTALRHDDVSTPRGPRWLNGAMRDITALGGFILVTVLKFVIARDRPDIVPPLMIEHTPSFPSGHSMMSAAVYLSLAGHCLPAFSPPCR